ncbi:MAG: hypothetical protein ACXW1Y_08710, partial [Acidimicrobiia bacterium]
MVGHHQSAATAPGTLGDHFYGRAYRHLERQARKAELGRKPGDRKPKRDNSDKTKTRQVNTNDPDSRILQARTWFVQGYNAQAAVSEDQVVVAAEVCNAAN